MTASFEWDFDKDAENLRKHGIGFNLAREAFADPKRVIARDVAHSEAEERFYCFGSMGGEVVTVRFTYHEGVIRIFGAGYRRKGKQIDEQENQIQR